MWDLSCGIVPPAERVVQLHARVVQPGPRIADPVDAVHCEHLPSSSHTLSQGLTQVPWKAVKETARIAQASGQPIWMLKRGKGAPATPEASGSAAYGGLSRPGLRKTDLGCWG